VPLIEYISKLFHVKVANVGDADARVKKATTSSAGHPVAAELPSDFIETDEFKQIGELISSRYPLIFVTGKAGTGKSTLIEYVRRKCDRGLAVVAPTGVAALNVRGATIHSFFRFPPRIIQDSDLKEVRNRRLYEKLEMLVIDEVSMVRADIVDAIDKFLRINGSDSESPFGGIQIVLVGDLFQLPPVVSDSEKRHVHGKWNSPFFFSSHALASMQMATVELSRIFRQADTESVELLNNVRTGIRLNDTIAALNRRCTKQPSDRRGLVTLTSTVRRADAINKVELNRLPTVARSYHGTATGKFEINENRLPSPLHLVLKPGAQVMFTRNDEMKRWVNGSMGVVQSLGDDQVVVETIGPDRCETCSVARVKWEYFRYIYDENTDAVCPEVIGRYTQFPLMPAWAVTIHKSQGKTLDRVHVDLTDRAFAPGQVYVALSRCRSLANLTFERPLSIEDVAWDRRVVEFYKAIG